MKNIKCANCKNLVNDWCDVKYDSPDPDLVRNCIGFEQVTNGDYIRAMSDEKLAGEINSMIKSLFAGLGLSAAAAHDYTDTLLGFLKQPFTGQEADEYDC